MYAVFTYEFTKLNFLKFLSEIFTFSLRGLTIKNGGGGENRTKKGYISPPSKSDFLLHRVPPRVCLHIPPRSKSPHRVPPLGTCKRKNIYQNFIITLGKSLMTFIVVSNLFFERKKWGKCENLHKTEKKFRKI